MFKDQFVAIMDISIEGPLSKWTNVVIGWQYRWFVLDEGSGVLWYYTVSVGNALKGRGSSVTHAWDCRRSHLVI